MSTPEPEWLRPFLKRYLNTIGPHDWPTEADEWQDFIEGWAFALAIPSPPVSEAEADAARVRLALSPPAFKRQHLPAVVEVVLKMRERDATRRFAEAVAADVDEARYAAMSRDCPECGGNGFALRKGVWADRSWHATASLYCRCSLGQYRLEKAYYGLGEAEHPPYDDLQAFPDLWNPSLSHPTWTTRRVPPPSVEGRRWRYLRPGEPPPPPISKAVRLGDAASRRRPDLGRVEPAEPIPAKPVPTPTPGPAVEAEEDYSWL